MPILLTLALFALIPAFFVWLLTYCLRMGVVGGGNSLWAKDAHRDKQPIRYWTGIAALAIGSVSTSCMFLYAVWLELRG